MRSRRAVLVLGLALTVLVPLAPPAGAADGPTVAVIGDYGSGTPAERAVAELVRRAAPDAVITTGDNVYDDADYAARVGDYYAAWIDRGMFFPALGNHDHAEGVAAFDDYFGYLNDRHAYTRVVGNVQFYVLDSQAALDSVREYRRQRGWLAAALPRSKARWQVVVLHHPPYSSGSVHGSTPRLQWPYGTWGADVVLAGHEHQYERVVRGGTTYVVDGAGGKDLYPFGVPVLGSRVRFADEHGALFLRETPDALVGEFRAVDRRVVDRFAIRD